MAASTRMRRHILLRRRKGRCRPRNPRNDAVILLPLSEKRCMRSVRYLLALVFFSLFAFAQEKPKPPDPHQQLTDRLAGIGDLAGTWKFHIDDVAHGEALSLDDSAWQGVDPTPRWEGHKWTGGSAWFRTTIEVPKLNKGYDLTDADIWVDQETDDDIIV